MLNGERLRNLRQEKGYTREYLAEIIGIGASQIQRHESGENDATGEVIARYARCFHVNTDYLLGLTVDPSPHIEGALSNKEAIVISSWRRGERLEAIRRIADDE